MTEISGAARVRANDLLAGPGNFATVFARFVQQVSDAAKRASGTEHTLAERERILARFILPEPVDPLVGVVEEAIAGTAEKSATQLREALAKRGLKIVEVKQ